MSLAALGVGSGPFRRALAAQSAGAGIVTAEMILQAEWIAGITLKPEDRETTARGVSRALAGYAQLRAIKIDHDVPPALAFQAAPLERPRSTDKGQVSLAADSSLKRPAADDDLAFAPVTTLSQLVHSRQVTSVELTKLYLDRLRRYDPALQCVVTLTEDLALEQAERADRELAAGKDRGPLHGIPWGAKDLIAWPGYPTTWGAPQFKGRVIDTKATVAARLEAAGAVLVAKLSLGALAENDRWFGGQTRNPWNVAEGSSGSSAGSAAATVAGLVGFSIGSETLGSIVSPCMRCGVTGLRPTFGRVSRHGCMTLAWSLDKIGPIARHVDDCALILAAIHGYDGFDPTAVDRPFEWPATKPLSELKVGYLDEITTGPERSELEVLRKLGVQLVPMKLPSKYPLGPLTVILDAESTTVFDELARQGVTEGLNRWPYTFRRGEFVPAVEYLRASRVRTLAMREMQELMAAIDLYVGGSDVLLANLTGHPTVIVPNGLVERNGVQMPTALTFTGRLFGESELLAVASAYQHATGFHLARPPMERLLAEK